MRYTEGYTLLELLVAMAIAGILAVAAVPSFTGTIDRNSRDSAMMDLTRALSFARSEAVTQGRPVSICASANQSTCIGSSGGNWKQGWVIFTDGDVAGAVDGEDEVLQASPAIGTHAIIALKNDDGSDVTNDYLTFSTDGFMDIESNSAQVYFRVCAADADASYSRAIWIAPTGRATMSVADANGVHDDVLGEDLVCP